MPDFDWQTIVALACVLGAAGWWVRRLTRPAPADSGCGTGCGTCPSGGAVGRRSGARPGESLPLVNLDLPRRGESPGAAAAPRSTDPRRQ
ncbi:MAG: FeoB-associated Cys-rich membrane protein [Planctomyces sp.]|nr:FeoB-associated Cys-rich membrane protein [Planctomyces sp.]